MTACSLVLFRTIILGRENSSWLVLHLFSAPARQYLITSVQTSHDGLFSICFVRQNVRTVLLGREKSSRLVLHLFSALERQDRSTWYGQLMTACSSFVQCASALVPQNNFFFFFFIYLFFRQLMTACSPFVQCGRMLEPYHLVGKIHNGLFFICLVRQCVITLVLRYRQLMTACSPFVQCAGTLGP